MLAGFARFPTGVVFSTCSLAVSAWVSDVTEKLNFLQERKCWKVGWLVVLSCFIYVVSYSMMFPSPDVWDGSQMHLFDVWLDGQVSYQRICGVSWQWKAQIWPRLFGSTCVRVAGSAALPPGCHMRAAWIQLGQLIFWRDSWYQGTKVDFSILFHIFPRDSWYQLMLMYHPSRVGRSCDGHLVEPGSEEAVAWQGKKPWVWGHEVAMRMVGKWWSTMRVLIHRNNYIISYIFILNYTFLHFISRFVRQTGKPNNNGTIFLCGHEELSNSLTHCDSTAKIDVWKGQEVHDRKEAANFLWFGECCNDIHLPQFWI